MNLKKNSIVLIIPFIIILISLFIITSTASTFINPKNSLNPTQINQYVDQTIDEITSYIQIKNMYGQFSTDKPYHISKIGVMISPMFQNNVDVSNIIIQVQTKNTVFIYTYNYQVLSLKTNSLFTNPLWNELNAQSFGIISIIDKDASIMNHHVLSDSSDLLFLAFLIPNDVITKGDYVTITISSGDIMQKTISFSTPLPSKNIVDLF